MSLPGRPKGEYRSAKHGACLMSLPGRPKGEYRSAEHGACLMSLLHRRIALIGCGAMGSAIAAALQDDATLRLVQIIVPADQLDVAHALCQRCASAAKALTALDMSEAVRPDLLVECAGHSAVAEHVIPALLAGVPVVLASIGALHDAATLLQLERAAQQGRTQLHLVSGAIAGIDGLAAARIGGLAQVRYTGRKPPLSWRGTPAEGQHDLTALQQATVIFEGTARDAARLYPKNANVAATVSLAGIGFDRTQVTLIADPAVTRNVHRLQAEGAFGQLDLTIANEPLPANPKSSALTVYSLMRAIRNATGSVTV